MAWYVVEMEISGKAFVTVQAPDEDMAYEVARSRIGAATLEFTETPGGDPPFEWEIDGVSEIVPAKVSEE